MSGALITQTFGFLSDFGGYDRRQFVDCRLAGRIIRASMPVAILGALTAEFVHDSVLLASYAIFVATLAFARLRNLAADQLSEGE